MLAHRELLALDAVVRAVWPGRMAAQACLQVIDTDVRETRCSSDFSTRPSS